MFQIKEQNKTSGKNLNETEIHNLSDKGFGVISMCPTLISIQEKWDKHFLPLMNLQFSWAKKN